MNFDPLNPCRPDLDILASITGLSTAVKYCPPTMAVWMVNLLYTDAFLNHPRALLIQCAGRLISRYAEALWLSGDGAISDAWMHSKRWLANYRASAGGVVTNVRHGVSFGLRDALDSEICRRRRWPVASKEYMTLQNPRWEPRACSPAHCGNDGRR